MKRRIAALLCVLTILLIGCGAEAPTLIGAWETDAEGKADFELYSDGTGLEKESMGTFALEWIAENGKLKVTIDIGVFGTVAQSFSYDLTEDTLILTDDEGISTTYTRISEKNK